MDNYTLGIIIVAVIFLGVAVYQWYLKKQGYDQGDIIIPTGLSFVKGVAAILQPFNPALAGTLISLANKIESLWENPAGTTAQVNEATIELNVKMQEALDEIKKIGINLES